MNDSKKKILVVEDEKNISDIIKFNLEKEGFEFRSLDEMNYE